jgi:hypothetical protein
VRTAVHGHSPGYRRLWLLLLALVVVAGAWLLLREPAPCSRPIPWDVGNVDPRHGMSRDDFVALIQEAIALWEYPSGRDLFVYRPGAPLRISLVYDDRQAEQDRLVREGRVLSEGGSRLEEDRSYLESMEQYYAELLARHNEEVSYWNQRMGAPPDEYTRLRRQESELRSLAARLDRMASRFEADVDSFNARVERYNQRASMETTAGHAIGRGEIEIFLLQGQEAAAALVAHELGHVLGLGHLDDPAALMYPLKMEGVDSPSASDLGALENLCGGG